MPQRPCQRPSTQRAERVAPTGACGRMALWTPVHRALCSQLTVTTTMPSPETTPHQVLSCPHTLRSSAPGIHWPRVCMPPALGRRGRGGEARASGKARPRDPHVSRGQQQPSAGPGQLRAHWGRWGWLSLLNPHLAGPGPPLPGWPRGAGEQRQGSGRAGGASQFLGEDIHCDTRVTSGPVCETSEGAGTAEGRGLCPGRLGGLGHPSGSGCGQQEQSGPPQVLEAKPSPRVLPAQTRGPRMRTVRGGVCSRRAVFAGAEQSCGRQVPPRSLPPV